MYHEVVMDYLTLQLQDYRLTTAEILYHLPDHPDILQFYIWQDFDLAPKFPVLMQFLIYWEKNLDGPLHSVKIASSTLIKPCLVTFRKNEFNV